MLKNDVIESCGYLTLNAREAAIIFVVIVIEHSGCIAGKLRRIYSMTPAIAIIAKVKKRCTELPMLARTGKSQVRKTFTRSSFPTEKKLVIPHPRPYHHLTPDPEAHVTNKNGGLRSNSDSV